MAVSPAYREAAEAARLLKAFNDYVASTDAGTPTPVTALEGLDADAGAAEVLDDLLREMGRLLDATAGNPAFDVITAAVDASQSGAFAAELTAIDADLTALGALIV